MWWAVGILLVGRALWYAAKKLWPDPKHRRSEHVDFTMPTSDYGTPIPLAWGLNRIQQPLLADRFGYNSVQRDEGDVGGPSLIVNVYGASMLFVLCLTPGQAELVSIQRMWFGEKEVEPGTDPFSWQPVYAGVHYDQGAGVPGLGRYIAYPGFLSGGGTTPDWNNGISGTVELRTNGIGTPTTDETAFYSHFVAARGPDARFPQYVGQIKVALSGVAEPAPPHAFYSELGASIPLPAGFVFGLDQTPQAIAFELAINPYADETSAPEYYKLVGLDWNPIGVVHDILTERVGLSEAAIDLTSFEDAATTLRTEVQGYSRVVYDLGAASDLIADVMNEIDGVFYPDSETGLLTVKLIRGDYVIGDLVEINPTNIVGTPELTLGRWADTTNIVNVVFQNRDKDYADDFVEAQNSSSVDAIGRRPVNIRTTGAKTVVAARAIAARKLKLLSSPLRRLKLTTNRVAADLRPGSVFAYVNADQGIATAVPFRVSKIDLGTLDDRAITIEAMEDAFHIETPISDGDVDGADTTPLVFPPAPIVDIHTDHAPRYVLYKASLVSGVPDTTPRLLHLAYPNDYDVRMRAQMHRESSSTIEFGGGDIPAISFPPTFTVETEYDRTLDPYDTGTGIRIQGIEGWTPTAASVSDIQSAGANLIRLGHGEGEEWIAFETVSDEGGGVFTLGHVWRGLFDTTPKTHPVGTRGYSVNPYADPDAFRRIGSHGCGPFGTSVQTTDEVTTVPISETGTALSTAVIDVLEIEAVKDFGGDDTRTGPRIELPYPVADLTVNALKEVAALEEDGADLDWANRARETNTVTRGDASSETVTATTTYAVAIQKTGRDELEQFFELTGPGDLTAPIHLGAAGHGDIAVKVRSFIDWDGDNERRSWQDASVNVEALFWRNLVINPRFATTSTEGWTVLSGTAAINTTAANQLGFKTGNRYVIGDGVDTDPLVLRQTIPVDGYDALGSLSIEVYSYALRQAGIGVDVYELLVEQLDSGGSTVDSDSYSGSPSTTTWEKQSVLLVMDPDCVSIRITATVTPPASTPPSTRLTEFCCRVVPTSGELITNGDFGTDVSSWTTSSGTWTRVTSTPNPYIGTGYVASTGVAANAELNQEAAIPTGFGNGVAVIEFAHTNRTDADDTHSLLLEALDGSGGSELASVDSGTLTTTTSQWTRGRLYLDLPPAATHLKVSLFATRVSDAGAPDAGFDDLSLKVYKRIDPTTDGEIDFTDVPETPLPTSMVRWYYDVPTVHPAPRMGLFAGGTVGEGAPSLSVPTSVTTGTRFVGPWDGTTCVYEAYRFTRTGAAIQANQSTYADLNYQDFTVIAVIKTDEIGFSDPCGLVGRRQSGASGRGWEISVDDTGHPVASLYGTTGTVIVTSSVTVDDGMLHMVALVSNNTDQELSIVVDGTWDTVAAATASIGGLRTFDASRFGIGRAHGDDDCFPGQIARVYMFWDALTSDDLSSWWKHNTAPDGFVSGSLDACAITVKDPDGGIAVQWIPTSTVPRPYNVALETGDENGWGLALSGTVDNLASALTDDPWTIPAGQVGSTFTHDLEDVQGKLNGFSMLGNTTTHVYVQVALGVRTTVRHVLFAKRAAGDGSVACKVELQDTTGAVKSSTTKTIGESWTRVDIELGSWDAATPNGRVVYYARDAAGADVTLILSGPHAVFQPPNGIKHIPVVLPIAGDASLPGGEYRFDPDYFDLGPEFNAEGEIRIDCQCLGTSEIRDGQIVNIGNDPLVDDKDRRLIDAQSGDVRFSHSDAAEAGVTSEITPTVGTLDDPWQIRARWNRRGVIEDAAGGSRFAGLEYNAQTDYDRAATFSATLTAAPTTIILGQTGALGPGTIMRRLRVTSRELPPV